MKDTQSPFSIETLLELFFQGKSSGAAELFHWIAERIGDGLLVLDQETRILYANKALCDALETAPERIIGRTMEGMLDPQSRNALRRRFRDRVTGTSATFQQKWILRDGREYETVINARPLFDPAGGFRGSIALVADVSERLRMENALAESEDRLRTLMNVIPDIICFRDADGKWIEASDSDLRLFNLQGKDYQGKTHEELCGLAPEYSQTFQACARTDRLAWEQGSMLRFEENIRLPDGRAVIHDTIKLPLYHESGDPKAMIVIGRDITERKLMEEALKESEGRYRGLFEDSPISLWMEDLSQVKKYYDELRAAGVRDFRSFFESHPEAVIRCVQLVKIVDVNRRTLELLAASSKQELLESLSKVLPPDEFPTVREEFIILAEGKTSFRGEIDHIALDGNRKHLAIQFNVVPGYEKSLERVVVSLLDITERKKAEEETRKSKALLEKTFAGLHEAVFIVDAESGTIIDANPAASEIFAYPLQDIIGRRPEFLLADESEGGPDWQTHLFELSAEGRLHLPSVTMRRSDGGLIIAESNISRLADEEGDKPAWVAVVRDITEESRYREQLERAQKLEALGALAGGIAHEINQPLNALKLYSSSLEMLLEKEEEVDRETLVTRLKWILAETDKIGNIISHMRRLVRSENPETESEADLNETVRRAVSLIGTQIASHDIHLQTDLDLGLPAVKSGSTQLEQVVINLCINAMQALNESGRPNKAVHISTGRDDDRAFLRVSDNGPGLPENTEDLFKPFFTTKRDGKTLGMGLGLSIVDTFIRSWGGEIIAGNREDGGAEFTVRLQFSRD
jgi:PAS domain S-box-containing protein